MAAAPPVSFRAPLTRPMKRRGLSGKYAEVSCDGPQLRFRGEKAGEFALSASMTAKMIVGSQPSKHGPIYKTHIWRSDEPERLTLQPFRDGTGYGAVMRAFAAAVQRSSLKPSRIETGSRRRDALFLPVGFGIVASLLVTAAWITMADRPLWEPMIPTSMALAIEALFVWDSLSSRWPRKAASLQALEPHLPQEN